MADLGSLIVSIESDISSLRKGLAQGNKEINSFANDTNKKLATIGAAFVAFATAATAAIGKVAEESIKFGNQLENMSRLSSATAADIARLGYAAQQSGGSFEALNRSFPTLASNLVKANEGNKEMLKAFHDLGVQTRNVDGSTRSLTAVYLDMANGVQNARDKTKALADVTNVMGRSGKDLFQTLSNGRDGIRQLAREFDKLGFSGEQLNKFAADSKRIDDVWTTIKFKFQLAGAAFTSGFLPALEGLSEFILKVDWVKFGQELGIIALHFVQMADAIIRMATIGAPVLQMMSQFGQVGGVGGFAQFGAQGSGAMAQGFGAATQGGQMPGQAPGQQGLMQPGMQQPGGGQQGQQGQGGKKDPQDELGGITQALSRAQKELQAFKGAFKEATKELEGLWKKMTEGFFNGFGDAMAGMIVYGEGFGDAMKAVFKDMAAQFISAIVQMIAKMLIWIAIALVARAFGLPVPDYSKFMGTSSSGFGFGGFKFDKGGAFMKSNSMLTAQSGMAMTGSFGERGIPAVFHPNEIISPIDKFFDAIQNMRPQTIHLSVPGYGQDPSMLAQTLAFELERKRRIP